jgi:hypothetical protein
MFSVCRIGGFAFALALAARPLVAQSSADSSKAKPTPDSTHAADSAGGKPQKREPFAFADFTWLTGNSREKSPLLDTKYFTGEFRADVTTRLTGPPRPDVRARCRCSSWGSAATFTTTTYAAGS